MPFAVTDDGVKLYYEETGAGAAIVFVHEFAADHRSWEMQMRHFGQRYRCVTYSARGYPPSDVPEKPGSYSQNRATDDILAVMDHLKIDKAHVVGLSMGGFATLHFGFRHPTRALSLVVAGVGYGAAKEQQATIHGEGEGGLQAHRPSRYDLLEKMRAITVPTLVLTGDEDWPCLAPSVLMKREIPSAALAGMPNCGHTINLEDPDLFNQVGGDFIVQVDSGRWPKRDPRAMSASITGMR